MFHVGEVLFRFFPLKDTPISRFFLSRKRKWKFRWFLLLNGRVLYCILFLRTLHIEFLLQPIHFLVLRLENLPSSNGLYCPLEVRDVKSSLRRLRLFVMNVVVFIRYLILIFLDRHLLNHLI
jgi:hypothetical protein